MPLALFTGRQFCKRCRVDVEAEEREQGSLSTALYSKLIELLKTQRVSRGIVKSVERDFATRGLKTSFPAKKLVYTNVLGVFCADKRITDAERLKIAQLRGLLDLADTEVSDVDSAVTRMGTIWAFERGEPPSVSTTGVALQKGEQAHLVLKSVKYFQERVVSRGYVGRSSGVSIRIMRGVSYRVGAHRGELVSRSAMVHLDTGRLTVTNNRIVFSGPQKGFSIQWKKIANMTPYADGISLVRDSTAMNNKPHVFVCDDAELLCVAASACMNSPTNERGKCVLGCNFDRCGAP